MPKPKELHYKRINGYIYASYVASDGRVQMSIGTAISPQDWAAKRFDKATKNLMNSLVLQVDKLAESRANSVEPVLKAEIEDIILERTGKKKKARTKDLKTVLTTYIAKIQSSDITNEGKPFGRSKIAQLSALIKMIDGKAVGRKLVSDFTAEDYQSVIKIMLDKKLSKNTMSAYNKALIKFFKVTRRMKWHNNIWYIDEDITIGNESIDTHVYLTEAEIETLYKMDCGNLWYEKTRDLFVFGCYIGLRHVDLGRLKTAVLKNGVLQIETKKRGKVVHIPLNSIARAIWDKYDGDMPTRWNNAFNDTIRELCKQAGFKEKCLYVRTQGGKRVEVIKAKHELIGTHTMRRSFATNAYLSGVEPVAIMKITGHANFEDFAKYIRISNQENATALKSHSFFQ